MLPDHIPGTEVEKFDPKNLTLHERDLLAKRHIMIVNGQSYKRTEFTRLIMETLIEVIAHLGRGEGEGATVTEVTEAWDDPWWLEVENRKRLYGRFRKMTENGNLYKEGRGRYVPRAGMLRRGLTEKESLQLRARAAIAAAGGSLNPRAIRVKMGISPRPFYDTRDQKFTSKRKPDLVHNGTPTDYESKRLYVAISESRDIEKATWIDGSISYVLKHGWGPRAGLGWQASRMFNRVGLYGNMCVTAMHKQAEYPKIYDAALFDRAEALSQARANLVGLVFKTLRESQELTYTEILDRRPEAARLLKDLLLTGHDLIVGFKEICRAWIEDREEPVEEDLIELPDFMKDKANWCESDLLPLVFYQAFEEGWWPIHQLVPPAFMEELCSLYDVCPEWAMWGQIRINPDRFEGNDAKRDMMIALRSSKEAEGIDQVLDDETYRTHKMLSRGDMADDVRAILEGTTADPLDTVWDIIADNHDPDVLDALDRTHQEQTDAG